MDTNRSYALNPFCTHVHGVITMRAQAVDTIPFYLSLWGLRTIIGYSSVLTLLSVEGVTSTVACWMSQYLDHVRLERVEKDE